MISGLCAVPVMFAVMGTLEIANTSNQRAKLQEAVDEGALTGAGRLSFVSTGGTQIAQDAAIATARQVAANAGVKANVQYAAAIAADRSSLTLDAVADHKAMIGFMGFGNQTLHVHATAENLGSIPLCVLQTKEGKGGIDVGDSSRIRATGCAVHANANIVVKGGAMIQADKTQAVGTVSGSMSPAGQAGALRIPDPFADMPLSPPIECNGKAQKIKNEKGTTLYLPAGVHCERYIIEKDATLILQPGDHWFMDDLDAKENAIIRGDDVTLIFGSTKKINFADRAEVQLGARKSGPYAGFLILTTRENVEEFTIGSDRVSKLLGTIYIPSAKLIVSTAGNVAQDSAWSIIVAETLSLRKNPTLVINNNYVGSGVPVPQGVGPNRNAPRLSK
ncbi:MULTISPECIES: TadE/TadG family type IV pilus assembly protein [Asticcacaulis]|uniref:TadE/TadG family type IV pilus assembly protein n=1 Tax=Asticcacaulis TaxID=76890 RepID=UPI001AE7BD77|nr:MULTISPECIES: hypothetical protein [Asticcacaulis]MBP2160433.1 hypothetical protein [Asticcacaulis solisilvae]MDR6801478.1 hypothetical protein [Asticcacaulis sp. BE141]